MKDYYLKSEIFVFPVIWHEPFGRSLLEAMNYGLPVIASKNIEQEKIVGYYPERIVPKVEDLYNYMVR